MTQLVIPTVWYVDGNLLVDATTLSGLVAGHPVVGSAVSATG
jgi:hypothetical protein